MPRKAKSYRKNPERLIGGFSALKAFLEKDGQDKDLLVDSGDWWQGTPEGGLTKGESVVSLMNALDYDVSLVGNHEYDAGEEILKGLVKKAKFPVLGANIYALKPTSDPFHPLERDRVRYLKPYIIRNVKGIKIGILGLLTRNMKSICFPKLISGLHFRRELDEAEEVVKELKEKGVDVIIALTHIGFSERGKKVYGKGDFEDDKFLARNLPEIDLIIGGHSHTFIKEPFRVKNTWIVQSGCYLACVGKARLHIDPQTKRVTGCDGKLFDLWIDEYGEDEDIKEIVKGYQKEVGEALKEVVATAKETLGRSRHGESSLGDWMTDCMCKFAKTETAFQNSGGIRSDMSRGAVTLRNLYEIMPFDNRLVSLSLSGAQIEEILGHGVSGKHGIIQVSGIKFEYDTSLPPEKCISDVWIGTETIKPEKFYTASTNDFLFDGGDGYVTFKKGKNVRIREVLVRDVLEWCAKQEKVIHPPRAARIIKK